MPKQLPRGVRNKNPGNIDRNATKWQGMAPDQGSDSRFVVFTSAEWGIRALAKTLMTYQSVHGLKTIKGIINRWAPPSENDTGAYVQHVAELCGVKATETIDVDTVAIMLPLVKAIIAHENGGYAYPESVVMEGIRRAGIFDAKPKALMAQKSFVAQAGAGVAVVGGACVQGLNTVVEYAPTVKGWANQLTDYAASPFISAIATGITTVAGCLVILGIVLKIMKHNSLKPKGV
jgi:hypothetical protein